MGTLGQIWKARKQIIEGVKNTIVKDEFVELVAANRMKICKTCKHFDGKCGVAGTGPCCGACGCSLKFKVRSMSTFCGKTTLGETPEWMAVMSPEEENKMLTEEAELLQKKQDEDRGTPEEA